MEHLIITSVVYLDELNSLLSYVPHLRRLSLNSLSETWNVKTQVFPQVLNKLAHVSLNINSVNFNQFEQLMINAFRTAEVFHLTISCKADGAYTDAEKWKQLILSHIPNLRILDFHFVISVNNDDHQLRIETAINHFTSAFWIERQWFFSHHFYSSWYTKSCIFYSTNPYRRKDYTLYKQSNTNTTLYHCESSVNSVERVYIDNEESTINCTNYFSNATELSLNVIFSTTRPSMTAALNRIVPLKQLTKLVITCDRFAVQKVIQILNYTPNIHTLQLKSMPCYRKKNDLASLKDSKDFQSVSNTNIITNVACEKKCTLEQIELLIALCPRVQHLTINGSIFLMEKIKRQTSNNFNNHDDNKRQKIQITTDRTTNLSTKNISQLEDLSNELIYDIFELLDHFHAYQAFSNLNLRFHHLLHNSNLPIKINFSNVSKSVFERYNRDIIKTNTHRITSLHFPDICSYDFIIASICKLSEFSRLEALILHNIESEYHETLLDQLSSLCLLSSLTITTVDRMEFKHMIYLKIFGLPVLKYCKLSFKGWNRGSPLPATTNLYSSVEHLIITSNITLNELYNLLSYVPHLRRLSLKSLSTDWNAPSQISPCLLDCLTHVSLYRNSTKFNELEHLVINTFSSVEVLRFTLLADSGEEYMDAKRWEQLIVLRIPNLRIFDIQLDICVNDHNDQLRSEIEIDHFKSPFWIERQWFFAHHFYQRRFTKRLIFYSTNPYRREHYTLYKQEDENTNLQYYESNLNSVQHVHIQSKESAIKCTNYFPNTTELILKYKFSITRRSITTILSGIIPLKRLTKLVVQCAYFSVQKIIQILCCSPNIHTLELQSIAYYRENNDFTSTEESQDFQEVSNRNTITNITCNAKCTLEQIKLLVALCPRIQYLTVNGFIDELESIMRFLLDKTNLNTRHLCVLCFSTVPQNRFKEFDTLIKSDALLDDYTLKIIQRKLYLWW